MNTQVIEHISSSENKPMVPHDTNMDTSQVFFPFLFLPFVALTGLATASTTRPPYYNGGSPGYLGAYPGGYGPGGYPLEANMGPVQTGPTVSSAGFPTGSPRDVRHGSAGGRAIIKK